MTSAWTEIARRAAEAEGEDERLDAEVAMLAFAPPGSKIEQSRINAQWCIYEPRTRGLETFCLFEGVPHRFRLKGEFTTSVDAVLALIKEKLPGWGIELNFYPNETGWDAALTSPQPTRNPEDAQVIAEASTAPLALLSAFALAMAEQGEAP
jgi:hypothetical protein